MAKPRPSKVQSRGRASTDRAADVQDSSAGGSSSLSVWKRIAFGAFMGLLCAALYQRYTGSKAPANLPPAAPMLRGEELDVENVDPEYLLRYGRTLLNPNVTRFAGEGGAVLAYVTPWNARGFDIAYLFRAKLTHVSPVWMQIRQKRPKTDPRAVHVTGHHDVNPEWITAMHGPDRKGPKIVPRFMFDGMGPELLVGLLTDDRTRREIVAAVVAACDKHDFDGVTLEVFNSLTASHMAAGRAGVEALVADLGRALRPRRQLVLVVPPDARVFGPREAARLRPHADFFSLMTYDYAAVSGEPGPNAPLPWVKATVEGLQEEPSGAARAAILTGLNFYGSHYGSSLEHGGGPIVGHEFLALLRARRVQMAWIDEAAEHVGQYQIKGAKHAVFFPTPRSVRERVQLARELGTGISIWELGQGLECFFDYL